jgi:hypothetical protein
MSDSGRASVERFSISLLYCLLASGGLPTTTGFAPRQAVLSHSFSTSSMSPYRDIHAMDRYQQSSGPLRMVSYEQLAEQLPSKTVIDAVEAKRGGKVVASDVASIAGVSLSQARKDLTALASLSRGDIAVDKEGELIYSFPANLPGVLSQNSAKFKALQTFQQIWPGLFWFIRVSFGVTLLASLVAIFSTIFFINSSSSSDNDDRRRDDRGGGGGGMSFGGSYFWGPSPFDFFFYRPYGYYGYYGQPEATRDPEDMGILESVFSYIFGDGNPNPNLEERRLSLAASVIRQNKGAVTAEQLAPFCDDAPDPSSVEQTGYIDEVRTVVQCRPMQSMHASHSPYRVHSLELCLTDRDSIGRRSSRDRRWRDCLRLS